ncbi:hypothetical protein, partial [Promicromonospora iranensis]|uniref:hypothetical protein n=1 Tax=Promicromonospora iranensis TaxID=1105144 RepID=UPI0023A97732
TFDPDRVRSHHDHSGRTRRLRNPVTYPCSSPVLFAGPLTLLIVATALLGEVCARRVQRTAGKLLVVSLVSAALLFGTAALLSTLGSAFLTDWSSMSLSLLPGWLLAGAGPRFWSWIAELDAAAAELDAEPAEMAQELR